MAWGTDISKWLDPYDVKARLLPGLLILLPAIIYFGLVWGPKNPVLVTLSSILSVCGGPYLLANFVRSLGLRAQKRLNAAWGGQPSTLMLQHRNDHLSEQTKLRYHGLITTKLGVVMPTPAEEAANPLRADQSYDAAADALRPLTNDRKKYDLLFKELVAYGYNRNAHGSRGVGVAVAVLVAVVTLFDAGVLIFDKALVQSVIVDAPHGVVLVTCVVLSLLWVLHFTAHTVEQSGFAYAKRLWEALEKVAKKPTGRNPPRPPI